MTQATASFNQGSAADLGGTIERSLELDDFIPTSSQGDLPLINQVDTASGELSTIDRYTTITGGMPEYVELRTGSVSLEDGSSATISGTRGTSQRTGVLSGQFRVSSVEAAFPVYEQGGVEIEALAGWRPGQQAITTGLQSSLSTGELDAALAVRSVVPVLNPSTGFVEFRGDVGVSAEPALKLTAIYTDRPETGGDTIDLRTSVKTNADGLALGLNSRVLVRPETGDTGFGLRMSVGSSDVTGELSVDHEIRSAGPDETVVQGRVTISF
ncbi:MAG: hypothetical protein AB8C46_07825 [Burkholderiaceae bacterium]